MKEKKPKGFHTPFAALKPLVRAPPKVQPPKAPPAERPSISEDEDALFRDAMTGVDRLSDPKGSPPPAAPRETKIVDDDAEALARLSELVSGGGPFDIADTDEYIEGAAPGVDRRVLMALRCGNYSVQGHVDLHGLGQAEAKQAVDVFLSTSRREGKRCVLIVHGRGLNSKDQIPVLKERLAVWLNRGRIGRAVLAFATARPPDGGAGAVYVLLRR